MSDMVWSHKVSDFFLLLLFATVCQLVSFCRNGLQGWCALPGKASLCWSGLLVADLGSTSGPRNVAVMRPRAASSGGGCRGNHLIFSPKTRPAPNQRFITALQLALARPKTVSRHTLLHFLKLTGSLETYNIVGNSDRVICHDFAWKFKHVWPYKCSK